MKKIVKKVGKSVAIIFTKEEQKVYDIKKDDIFDLELNKFKPKK